MKIKKILALLLSVVMLLSVMTACAPEDDDDTKGNVPGTTQGGFADVTTSPQIDTSKYQVTEKTTIEFWHSNADGTTKGEWIQQVCEEFNASQDMITVVPVYNGSYSDTMTLLGAAIQAKEGIPAVCCVNMDEIYSYMSIGMMEPLQDYAAAYDLDLTDYVESFLDVATLDGNLYAIPQAISAAVFLYNKTVLSELGLDEFPTDMESYKAWVKEVYEKTGKTAYACSANQNNILYNYGVNWGGTLVGEDGKTDFCNETVQSYVAQLKELHDAGYITWSNEGTGALSTMFKNGDVMSLNISCTTYATLTNAKNNPYEVGIGWNYMCDDAISTLAGSSVFIPSELPSQNDKNAAFVFMMYLTNAENSLSWSAASSYLVTHYSIINDESKMEVIYNDLPEMVKVYNNLDRVVKKQNSLSYSDTMKIFRTGVAQIIIENADPETTWQQVAKDMNVRIAEDG